MEPCLLPVAFYVIQHVINHCIDIYKYIKASLFTINITTVAKDNCTELMMF